MCLGMFSLFCCVSSVFKIWCAFIIWNLIMANAINFRTTDYFHRKKSQSSGLGCMSNAGQWSDGGDGYALADIWYAYWTHQLCVCDFLSTAATHQQIIKSKWLKETCETLRQITHLILRQIQMNHGFFVKNFLSNEEPWWIASTPPSRSAQKAITKGALHTMPFDAISTRTNHLLIVHSNAPTR